MLMWCHRTGGCPWSFWLLMHVSQMERKMFYTCVLLLHFVTSNLISLSFSLSLFLSLFSSCWSWHQGRQSSESLTSGSQAFGQHGSVCVHDGAPDPPAQETGCHNSHPPVDSLTHERCDAYWWISQLWAKTRQPKGSEVSEEQLPL